MKLSTTFFIKSMLLCAALIAGGTHAAQASQRPSQRLSEGTIHYEKPSAAGVDDFKAALKIVLNRMLQSYASAVKEPLGIYVLDTTAPSVRDFYRNSQMGRGGKFDPHTVLGLSFDPYAKIDGKRTAACMVRYNSDRRMELLAGYERSGVFNKQEIVYYLASHEFGHCIAFHQAQLGNGPVLNAKEHEYIADQISVAFFHINGNEASARRVLEFNRKLVGDELHSHPDRLAAWYENLKIHLRGKDPRQEVSSFLDLYRLAMLVPTP